ncbi:hypothetical protein FAI40_10125 [Acetobacteraceae bacterium]|nr:hypothetical protein FAI40_10125 [Acetobacteraceae bacterium]
MQIQVSNPTSRYLLALINDCEGFANGANPVKPQSRDTFIYNVINRLKVIHKIIISPSALSNTMSRLKNTVPHTMSSREIARITGKKHYNVLRDCRDMLSGLNFNALKFEAIEKDARNRDKLVYLLPKDLTLTLVSGYNVKMRHAIVKRWMELEGGATSQTESFYEKEDFRKFLMWQIDGVVIPNVKEVKENIENLSDDYLKSILRGLLWRGTLNDFAPYILSYFPKKSISSGALTLFPSPEGEKPQLLKIREACKMLSMNQNEFSNLIISHGFATRDEKRRLIPTKRGIKEKIVVHFHYKRSGAIGARIPLKSIPFIKKLPFLLG